MTTQQVKEEKLAIQRVLLEFESVHGKPSTKSERDAIRPLYDRYRCVKRLLVRSGTFPGAISKNKDVCTELQPILEHETMNFTSPQHRIEIVSSFYGIKYILYAFCFIKDCMHMYQIPVSFFIRVTHSL